MTHTKLISPIAIDMGAKNTGVYYAHYNEGSTIEEITKKGEVLIYGNYTSLLGNRTKNRHTRRNYQRKKLAKRLLTVILKEYFNFPAERHSQAIGFLLNRRGFSFLEEKYSPDDLNNFPEEAWAQLSDEVKGFLDNENKNISDKFIKMATNSSEKITDIFKAIHNIEANKKFREKDTEIKKEFVYLDFIEKINKACTMVIGGVIGGDAINENNLVKNKKDKQKLSQTSNWIIEKLNKKEKLNLKCNEEIHQTNLIEQITQSNAKRLKQNLPNFEELRKEEKKKEKENNKSIWSFNMAKFEFNAENEEGLEENETTTHLHHFCYAVYKINDEITSGSRHRSKFFDEIKDDLEKFNSKDFLHGKNPQYLKDFISKINNNQLDTDKLHKLVCHISNLELRVLRKYYNDDTKIDNFNKKLTQEEIKKYRNKTKRETELSYLKSQYPKNYLSHKGGDKFNNQKLSRLVANFFIKQWQVTEKDGDDKKRDYKNLKNEWKNYKDKNNIIDFWLKTDPVLTIPPYSKMFNRHPPKCQSLLLNLDYLEKHYQNWQEWLKQLESSNHNYQCTLKELKAGKGKKLLNNEQIKLRQLQLILDTAKKIDPYQLNEIWSIYHQWQKPSTKNKEEDKLQKELNGILETGKLPAKLKEQLAINKFTEQGSFGHFLNKYYQTRRKARDGRYFLIQEKKEKWLTDGKMLTLCTHKPRQKRHQWQIDLAAVLGITENKLIIILGENKNKPEKHFKDIKGACEKAAKAQKDYRGGLKSEIEYLSGLNKKELKDKKDKDLVNLAKGCFTKSKEDLLKDIPLINDKDSELQQKIALVFKFAQIHNIIFKERSGFSSTCPVCATDNGFRMQKKAGDEYALASRLPALSIRLIDGVVMRICDAIARHTAVTKWQEIEKSLTKGHKVSIPIILEQNRFEFEPTLKQIKQIKQNKKEIDKNDQKEIEAQNKKDQEEFNKKNERIKEDSQKTCPYHGTPLEKDGETDHIIPRASKYGTLNDEANLIYVSKLANQGKTNQAYYLKNLNDEYKCNIFGNHDENKIKEFIYEQLEGKKDNKEIKKAADIDKDSDYFVFGRYSSFINLNEDQKKAFRHALFLEDNDPLKLKVINALQNRRRTIVNGTQRYLAQCIADKIHRIARREGKTNQIDFDYFEFNAKANTENSTHELREYFANFAKHEQNIKKPDKQSSHSHLIDAQMAFLLALDNHKNDGTMGIKFKENETICLGDLNIETGEFEPKKYLDATFIDNESFKKVDLSPKDSNQKIVDIQEGPNLDKKQYLHKIFKRTIFGENAMGERYKPIVKFKDKWYLGYPRTNDGKNYDCKKYCTEVSEENLPKIEEIIEYGKYYKLKADNNDIKIWTIKKIDQKYKQIDEDSHKYFSKLNPKYDDEQRKEVDQIKFIWKKCKFYVKRVAVEQAPKELKKDNLKNYPFYENWKLFDKKWRDEYAEGYAINRDNKEYDLSDHKTKKKWDTFCKNYFKSPKRQTTNSHDTKGKKYTMTSKGIPQGVPFRINRRGRNIYQTMPLDTNIIDEDKSNFLIKHSKNVTLLGHEVNKNLSAPIKSDIIDINQDIEEIDIFKYEFLKNNNSINDSEVKANLTNNWIIISNMPYSIFESMIANLDTWNQKDNILFNQPDNNKPQPLKDKVKEIFKLPIRCEGLISKIKINENTTINNTTINFNLPCRKKKMQMFVNNLKKPND